MDTNQLLKKILELTVDKLLSLNPFLSKEVFTSNDAKRYQKILSEHRKNSSKLKTKYKIK